jgi:hypothetical protein
VARSQESIKPIPPWWGSLVTTPSFTSFTQSYSQTVDGWHSHNLSVQRKMLEDHTYHQKIGEHYMLTGLCSPVEREREKWWSDPKEQGVLKSKKSVCGGNLTSSSTKRNPRRGATQVSELQKAKFSVCSKRRCPAVEPKVTKPKVRHFRWFGHLDGHSNCTHSCLSCWCSHRVERRSEVFSIVRL